MALYVVEYEREAELRVSFQPKIEVSSAFCNSECDVSTAARSSVEDFDYFVFVLAHTSHKLAIKTTTDHGDLDPFQLELPAALYCVRCLSR